MTKKSSEKGTAEESAAKAEAPTTARKEAEKKLSGAILDGLVHEVPDIIHGFQITGYNPTEDKFVAVLRQNLTEVLVKVWPAWRTEHMPEEAGGVDTMDEDGDKRYRAISKRVLHMHYVRRSGALLRRALLERYGRDSYSLSFLVPEVQRGFVGEVMRFLGPEIVASMPQLIHALTRKAPPSLLSAVPPRPEQDVPASQVEERKLSGAILAGLVLEAPALIEGYRLTMGPPTEVKFGTVSSLILARVVSSVWPAWKKEHRPEEAGGADTMDADDAKRLHSIYLRIADLRGMRRGAATLRKRLLELYGVSFPRRNFEVMGVQREFLGEVMRVLGPAIVASTPQLIEALRFSAGNAGARPRARGRLRGACW